MSATALKLTALVIRSLAKPIATRIKNQARDHPRFRNVCITIAQNLHRVDMRMRLGLLRDTSANIEKAEVAEKSRRHAEALKKMKEAEAIYPAALGAVRSDARAPTTATTSSGTSTTAVKAPPPRIRPLSESKAIDAGANFISESFLVAVAATMVLLEALRSRRKEARNKDTVAERLELLESQNRQDIIRLEQLEEAAILTGERVMDLEEQVWRLQGGKGEFRARGSGVDVKAWTPLPLWEPPVKAAGNIWSNIVDLGQNFGGKKVVDDKAVVAMANAKN